MSDFINSFEKGMHKDSILSGQPEGTVRDVWNKTLISSDGNHYVYETMQGNYVSFILPDVYEYDEALGSNGASARKPLMPVGIFSLEDKLVVHSTFEDSANGGYGQIGIVTLDKDGIGNYTTYINTRFSNQKVGSTLLKITIELLKK